MIRTNLFLLSYFIQPTVDEVGGNENGAGHQNYISSVGDDDPNRTKETAPLERGQNWLDDGVTSQSKNSAVILGLIKKCFIYWQVR